jgi:DNA-binding response OmpR family regulator
MDTAIPSLNILVVEDNENLRESIVDALESLGHHVRGIACAEELPEQIDLLRLDLAILDLNLPGEDGLSLAGRLRETHPELGIIMLTARVQSEDRAAGYAQGADIYLTKPASLTELEHAIGALARRLKPPQIADQSEILTFDSVARTLASPNGESQSLTMSEVALITAFIRASQNILETWQIAEILGMSTETVNKPAIELHIVRLRKKLPTAPADRSPIQSIRGRGYQLCVPIRMQR